MSNSPLVVYTKLSPNHSGKRTRKIDTITIHCIVGQLSLERLGEIFASKSRQASSNYGVDNKGRVGMYVEEQNRSWCSSSNTNDQRAVTIEVACDLKPPYKITDAAMKGLIALCADICRRNDIPDLKWKADKNLIGKVDQQNMTAHRWFSNTLCPGEYIYSHLGHIAAETNKILKPQSIPITTPPKPVPFIPYTVRIKTNTSHFRSGGGSNHPIRGTVRKNEVYTIIEEAFGIGASKWGKLKSGAGWLSLDDCVKTG